MVLLTYQDENALRESISEKEAVGKNEGPKTPYIDKLYAFKEEYADEEKCDLFFICKDGEIPAHRLVISNASKYIMAMQDDLPPWYPVYISIPDLTKEIVQTLVRLAYTGQMNIPPGTTTEELVDAMQALGWINTDCLTANYLDTSSASTEDDFGIPVSSKTAESLETVLKMKFPVTTKGESDNSDDDDDDDGMEMAVPDIPSSDEDEKKAENAKGPKSKKGAKGRRQKAQQKKVSPVKPKVSPRATRLQSPSPKSTASTSKTPEEPTPSGRRGSRKVDQSETKNATPNKKQKQAEATTNSSVATIASPEPEAVRSRTRTIRKPKKFDDLIVMTPTKRKDSPTKSPTKPLPAKSSKPTEVEKGAGETAKNPRKNAVTKTISNNITSAGAKNRRSTSSENKEAIRNSLITSYFNKRSTSNSTSNDTSSTETHEVEDDSLESNSVQIEESHDADELSNKGDKETTNDKKSNNTASLRKRVKSNASTKSDKEDPVDEANVDSETPSNTKRTRNSEVADSEKINPTRRGRKASSVSTSSKSSNKEPVTENDVEEGENGTDAPRKKRLRQ